MSKILSNVLEQIMSIAPPYHVLIKPIGVAAEVATDHRGVRTLKRDWIGDTQLDVDHFNISFMRLRKPNCAGYITILRDDYYTLNQESYESIYNCFDTPQSAIAALLKAGRKGLTFWNTEVLNFDTYQGMFDYLFSIIEDGVFIDSLSINQTVIYLDSMPLTAVWAKQTASIVTPVGRILRAVNGTGKHNVSHNYVYVGNIYVPDTGTRAIVGNGAFLPNSYTYVDDIYECPACGGDVTTQDGGIYCPDISCSPLRDTFINSISRQTAIPNIELINQFNQDIKFHYITDCIIEEQHRRELPLNLFATFMDILSVKEVVNVVKYLYGPKTKDIDYQYTTVCELIDTYIATKNDEATFHPTFGPLPPTPKVIVTGSFYNISDHAISLMLKRAGLEITHIVDEALFALSGNTDDEFNDYIRENTNMFILVSDSPSMLSNLLK